MDRRDAAGRIRTAMEAKSGGAVWSLQSFPQFPPKANPKGKKKPRAAELQAMGLKAEGIAVYLCSEQTDQEKEDEGEVSRISSARELVFLLACHTRENNLLDSFRQTLLCSQFCVCKQSAMAVEFEWMSSGPRNPWECKDERNLICSASISQDHLNAVNLLFFFQTRAGGEIRIIQCEEE